MIDWKKVFLGLPLLLTACAAPQTPAETKNVWVMDTACTISLHGGSGDAAAQRLSGLEQMLDNYDPDSDISRLNAAGTLSGIPELAEIAAQTADLQQRFGSRVDLTVGKLTALWGITTDHPHVPSAAELRAVLPTISPAHVSTSGDTVTLADGAQLDCGAVAKGYALDQVKALLEQDTGITWGTVSMTSSILCYGEKPDGAPFRLEIRDPDGDGVLGTASVDACFLSTSGGYERYFTADDGKQYCHILDPVTGMPAETDLTTVTVFCDSGLMSDFLSTSIWMEGTAGIESHLHAADYQIVAQDKDGTLYVSDGLDFTPND